MILPFYDSIDKQEFRKFIADQDLLRAVKFYSECNELNTFQHVFSNLPENPIFYVVYIDNYGNEITRIQIPNSYFTILNKKLVKCNGGYLGFEHPFCQYYISISDMYFSEVVSKVLEIKSVGRLKLNTGAFVLLNTGGYILLNDAQLGFTYEKMIRFELSNCKNFNGFDLSNFVMKFLVYGEIYLENSKNEDTKKTFSGLDVYFQRTTQRAFTLKFLATRQIASNLDFLRYFEKIKIIDNHDVEYNCSEVVLTTHERIETSGIYEVTLEFHTDYTYEVKFSTNNQNTDDMGPAEVGLVMFCPSTKSVEQLLTIKNSYYQGKGFKFIHCEGQKLEIDNHPILADTMGVVIDGGISKIQIPDNQGKFLIGTGTGFDGDNYVTGPTGGSTISIGKYKVKLSTNEMLHFHESGIAKNFNTIYFMTNENPDGSGLIKNADEITDIDAYRMSQFLQSNNDSFTSFNYGTLEKYKKVITSNNGSNPIIRSQQEGHNNVPPAIGGYFLMFIDDLTA